MRTLAIDLGTRRVGLAMSDEGGRFAMPFDVIEVTIGPDQAIDPIVALVRKEGVQRVIIGLPLNMEDGSFGPAARDVVLWSGRLAMKVVIPILYVDERLSSFQAEQDLIDQKRAGQHLTRGMKKDRLDAQAAAVFLQEFLDGKLQPIELG
jgi:putative Holliday junction resolvase